MFLYYLSILVVSIVIGQFCALTVAAIPSEMRLSADIPVHPLTLVTVALSIVMILKLFRSLRSMKNRTTSIGIIIIILYSIAIWAVSTETPENITFNIPIISYLTYLVCIIAIMPFFSWTRFIKFSEEHFVRESTYFATSTMWLSPFIAEIYIWAKWFVTGVFWEKASYMTLGGAGTQDVLFWQGFLALILMTSFHFLRIITFPIFEKYFIHMRTINVNKISLMIICNFKGVMKMSVKDIIIKEFLKEYLFLFLLGAYYVGAVIIGINVFGIEYQEVVRYGLLLFLFLYPIVVKMIYNVLSVVSTNKNIRCWCTGGMISLIIFALILIIQPYFISLESSLFRFYFYSMISITFVFASTPVWLSVYDNRHLISDTIESLKIEIQMKIKFLELMILACLSVMYTAVFSQIIGGRVVLTSLEMLGVFYGVVGMSLFVLIPHFIIVIQTLELMKKIEHENR